MKQHDRASWTAFEDSTQADWDAVAEYEVEYNAGLVDRLLELFRLLDENWSPYPVNQSLPAFAAMRDTGA